MDDWRVNVFCFGNFCGVERIIFVFDKVVLDIFVMVRCDGGKYFRL